LGCMPVSRLVPNLVSLKQARSGFDNLGLPERFFFESFMTVFVVL
jgi:hypothetical protein